MDALVKVVLVFFISLLSFSVGTFVGKQVSDSDHRRASLEGDGHGENAHGDSHAANSHDSASGHEADVAHHEEGHGPSQDEVEDLAAEFIQDERSVASLDEQETSAPDEDGYTSYKKDSSKPASEETHPAAKEEHGNAHSHEKTAAAEAHGKSHATERSHEETKKAQAKHEKPHSQPLEAAKAISQGKAPTSGKEVEKPRKPSSSLPAVASTSIGKYTVQVASYAAEDDAKKYASSLKSKGWNAFYVPAEIKGTTWYRVSVGLFDEPGSAGEFKTKFLKTSGAKDALVVKIVQ